MFVGMFVKMCHNSVYTVQGQLEIGEVLFLAGWLPPQASSTCEILIVIVCAGYSGCDHNETVHHHATKPTS